MLNSLGVDNVFQQKVGNKNKIVRVSTVLPAKSDSDVMFCLQSYQRLIINRSLVY